MKLASHTYINQTFAAGYLWTFCMCTILNEINDGASNNLLIIDVAVVYRCTEIYERGGHKRRQEDFTGRVSQVLWLPVLIPRTSATQQQ